MRLRVLGLLSIVALPGCWYWDMFGQDAGVDGAADARRDGAVNSRPDAPVDAAHTCTVESYDWNDGTTQGWSASTSVSNVAGALIYTNQGNGSLQAFGPQAATSLDESDLIFFTVRIDQYSTVTAPSELVSSFLYLETPFAGEGALAFQLNVSGLTFGQPRSFMFGVSSGTFTGSLTRAEFLAHVKFASFMFADQHFTSNTSAGMLDDFKIVHTNCAP